MPNLCFVFSLLVRVRRGERLRQGTPEERRTDGASFGLAGLMGLLLLSIGPDVWTAPPVLLWTGVILALAPLAVFSLWLHESVPPTWNMAVGLCIPAIAFILGILQPQGSFPPVKVAQGGLILYVVLLILGSRAKKAG